MASSWSSAAEHVGEMLSLKRLGTLFYVVTPNATTFETVEEVPNYINEAIPWFIVSVVVEHFLGLLMLGRKPGRLADNLTSVGHATLYESFKLFTRWFEMSGYLWLYQHRFFDIPWRSPLAWWAGFIAADFVYYWFHRASHEVSVIWAWHQVHHSHEDYNVTVALRQSMFQRLCALGFYHPMALLGVPLPAICVHWHLNLLVQFLIHTDLVGKCGPLEWIFNTPSHHRVHHGANKYCLDKNYGGFLIVWDRLFGTFEEERDDDPVVYGLVDQPQASGVLYLQFFYIRDVVEKARQQATWGDSMRALLYGPGWVPGAPRLGDMDTFPDVKAPRAKYDPQIPFWLKVYVSTHFLVILFLQQLFTFNLKMFPMVGAVGVFLFILTSIGNITAIFDSWPWVGAVELLRCGVYVAYARSTPVTGLLLIDHLLTSIFFVSAVIWTFRTTLAPLGSAAKILKAL
ncbi:alkylglycerol monooxygenase-like [Portunus trituberculatus]|uniref:alkylglycerol monooxygenase-like n=1 Tax=Portunus trituberculatus TaxID=210409 RepID=UPI001E1D172A|nr:alkylglycerol monooxygenase-like [Portunus trituberculatus]